jgi:tetratricopeptide (TPR) repeat protein
MLPVLSGRRQAIMACAVLIAVAMALPAAAQSTGMVKGKVVDGKGQPIVDAKITIDAKDGITRTVVTKTNKKGEYTQIGLAPGNYKLTAEKDKSGSQAFDGRVRLGDVLEVNFKLDGTSAAGPSKEDIAKSAAVKKLFDDGVAASRGGDNDTAVAKFAEATTLMPNCFDCFYNMGYAYAQKKDYAKSEEAYKKSIDLKPDYMDAYNGLAQIYNAQKKFDEAMAISQKAASLAAASGTGGADALYNVGVTAWNNGKAEDAKKAFEDAIKADPKHANSHYQLAMCLINLGKLPEAAAEFELYLQIAPDGQFAAQVKAMLTQIKK